MLQRRLPSALVAFVVCIQGILLAGCSRVPKDGIFVQPDRVINESGSALTLWTNEFKPELSLLIDACFTSSGELFVVGKWAMNGSPSVQLLGRNGWRTVPVERDESRSLRYSVGDSISCLYAGEGKILVSVFRGRNLTLWEYSGGDLAVTVEKATDRELFETRLVMDAAGHVGVVGMDRARQMWIIPVGPDDDDAEARKLELPWITSGKLSGYTSVVTPSPADLNGFMVAHREDSGDGTVIRYVIFGGVYWQDIEAHGEYTLPGSRWAFCGSVQRRELFCVTSEYSWRKGTKLRGWRARIAENTPQVEQVALPEELLLSVGEFRDLQAQYGADDEVWLAWASPSSTGGATLWLATTGGSKGCRTRSRSTVDWPYSVVSITLVVGSHDETAVVVQRFLRM